MPQSSRPRIVPTTPPFVPSTATQPQIDPMELVQQLLNPAPPTPPSPPSPLDRVGAVLSALAQGVSVGISNDPGRALQGQLQQQQQMKFQADQTQKERDERLQNLNRQFGLQVLGGQIQEQQQIRQEDRAEKRNQTARQNAMDDYIKKNQIEFDFGTRRDKSRAELEKADAILKHSWDVEKQHNQEYQFWYQQSRLENKELFDQKIRLITSGIPAGMANNIANKMFQGEDLTAAESKTITAAAQRQMKLATRSAGGGGSASASAGMTPKQEAAYFAARMKDNFVVIETPAGDQIVEMSNAPKDNLGRIIGMKRIASDGEKLKKLADEADGLQALRNPGVRQQLRTGANPQQQNVQGGPDQVRLQFYTNEFNKLLSEGKSPEEIASAYSQAKLAAPSEAAAIDAALTKLPKSKQKVSVADNVPYGPEVSASDRMPKKAGGKLKDLKNQASKTIFQ